MILRGHDNVEETRDESSHGGVGKYAVRTLLDGDGDSGLDYVRDLVLEAGSTIGVHEHQGDEEIYYVISGQGRMIVDDEECPVKLGDVVLTKSGSSHGLVNEGDGELKIFVACVKL